MFEGSQQSGPDAPLQGLVRMELRRPTKRQILDSALWFVRLRWFASLGVALGGLVGCKLGYDIECVPILAVASYLFVANVGLFLHGKRMRGLEPSGRHLARYSMFQVFVDWLGVIALVHWTGGVSSPALFFFFFHLVMSSILQPARRVYPVALVVVAALGSLFWAEASGWVNHHPLLVIATPLYRDLRWVLAVLGTLALSAVSTVFLTTWVAELLRRRMVQLARAKINLEHASRKIEAVFHVVNSLGTTQELDELLERVVKEAVALGDIGAAFVSLIEPTQHKFTLAAMHGMEVTEDQPQHLEFLRQRQHLNPLERGKAVFISDLEDREECDNLRCFDWLRKQGRRSLMSVPLRVGNKLTGVLCLACVYPNRFEAADARYFQAFADLISVGIEGARATQLLMEHNRSRTWFFNRVAHDLRAPLSAMRSMLTLITDGYVEEPEKVRELAGRVRKRADGFNEMVNDLLALADDRLGEIREDAEGVDIRDILARSCELFEAECKDKGLEFQVDLGEGSPVLVMGTPGEFERVFSNLLSNAVKYTPQDGGKVEVTLSTAGMEVMVQISDTGIGIPAESQQDLFQEFFRAPNARKMTQVGTGLGLRITRKLVESYGGAMHFTSVEDEGSTFVVSFPRQWANPSVEASKEPETP